MLLVSRFSLRTSSHILGDQPMCISTVFKGVPPNFTPSPTKKLPVNPQRQHCKVRSRNLQSSNVFKMFGRISFQQRNLVV